MDKKIKTICILQMTLFWTKYTCRLKGKRWEHKEILGRDTQFHKIDFTTKAVTRYKKRYYIVIKVTTK